MAELKIYCLNVRGLKSDTVKRKKIFANFNKYKSDIVFLQETHSTNEIETTWAKDWNGQIIYRHGSSRSRGVVIMINKSLIDHIKNIQRDTEGRWLIVELQQNNISYTLINIYAPTQNDENDQIRILNEIKEKIIEHEYTNIIMGGDFNIVLDPVKDKKGGNTTINRSTRYINELKTFSETLSLCDIWRTKKEGIFGFTWHCKATKIFCRLDFWLISNHLCNNVTKVDILPTVNSDHSIIHISIKTLNPKRGPSYWKFNASLLNDDEYVKMIKNVIKQSAKKHEHANKNLQWELIKMEIRSSTITYSKIKKAKQNEYEKNVRCRLKDLHELVSQSHDIENLIAEITGIETELQSIENESTHGIILRSKIKWAEDNEKKHNILFESGKK